MATAVAQGCPHALCVSYQMSLIQQIHPRSASLEDAAGADQQRGVQVWLQHQAGCLREGAGGAVCSARSGRVETLATSLPCGRQVKYGLKVCTLGLHGACNQNPYWVHTQLCCNPSNACSTGWLCSNQQHALEGQAATAACSGPAHSLHQHSAVGCSDQTKHVMPPAAVDVRCQRLEACTNLLLLFPASA